MFLFGKCANTNQQGALGESVAELYFRVRGYEVARLGSHAPYDMIVSKGTENQRIQVKTSRTAKGKLGTYTVLLRTNYGHGDRSKYKTIDATLVQKVFIVTNSGDCYLIPADVLDGKNCVTLNAEYYPYYVGNLGMEVADNV